MKNILDIKIEECDAGEDITIKEYLKLLLEAIWIEGESFSGKRPFGNSGWEYDLYKPLILAKVIKGEIDSDGCVDSIPDTEKRKANKLILEAIQSL